MRLTLPHYTSSGHVCGGIRSNEQTSLNPKPLDYSEDGIILLTMYCSFIAAWSASNRMSGPLECSPSSCGSSDFLCDDEAAYCNPQAPTTP